jgi:LuxR family maltose regulon positive regulatory protein
MAAVRAPAHVPARVAGPRPAPLEARRRPPRPRGALVVRDRLLRQLQGDVDAPLVLMVAPAGYGKSTLLTQWAEHDKRPFAWLTLERSDNDPVQLLSSMASVLHAHGLVPAQRGSRGVREALLRSVDSARTPFVLVLDDVQVLTSETSLRVLVDLVGHLPPGSQLGLASRTEPALPVGGLRVRRMVTEIRAADLTMAPSEAALLVSGAGVSATPEQIEELTRETEGWPAAIYLAALGSADRDARVRDYVRDEIFPSLTPDELAFLCSVSVLERLSPPVCDGVLRQTGSARLLRDLSRSNVPLFAAGAPDCFRLNSAMAGALRAELRLADPELERELHRRAAVWFAARGDVECAAGHAVEALDAELTGRILWSSVIRHVTHGRDHKIKDWLGSFSDAEIADHPALALVAAAGWLAQGDFDKAEHWTAVAARGLPGSEQPELVPSLEAGVAILRAAIGWGGIDRMGEEAARAYELFPDGNPWLATCCLVRGVASDLRGSREEARTRLREGACRGAVSAPSAQALCLTQLALMALDDEDWAEAGALVGRARAQIERFGLTGHPGAALVYAVSATVRAHAGRVDQATIDLRQAAALFERLRDPAPWYEAEVRIARAQAALRLSEVGHANDLLAGAARLVRRETSAVALAERLAGALARAGRAQERAQGGRSSLTTAELRVLQFLPTHLSFPEIATRLNVSANTVKTHARAVYRKLDSSSRDEAVAHARAAGLVEANVASLAAT